MSATYMSEEYQRHHQQMTEKYEGLRHQVREFAMNEVAPRVEHMEASGSVELDLPALIAAQGWIGVTIPAEYGGMDAGHLAKTIIIEEISRVSGAMGAMTQASQLGVAKIIHYGNEEQKRTWLPQIAEGRCLPTIAVTEPCSGSHVLGMQSTAERNGDGYVLTGRKIYVGNSHIGDLHGVVVRTGSGSKGLSAFLVEADRPGLSLIPHRRAMGLHGFSFGEIVLDRCHVPAANLVGNEGDGLAIAYSSSVLYGRPNLTAVSLGIHQAIVAETTTFVQERQRYGHPLAELPTIENKIGLLQHRLMTARATAYEAVRLLDIGQPCDAELMNAKYVNVEASLDSARSAMDIHGAAGLFPDRPVERFLRDAFHPYAAAGTGDIQLHRLAETALGTSRVQWSQRLASALAARPDAAVTGVSD